MVSNTYNVKSNNFIKSKVYELRNKPLRFKSDSEILKKSFERVPDKDEVDKKNAEIAMAVLSPIPQIRKVSSVPNDLHDGNWLRALGIIAYAVMFLPEDTRDVMDAVKQSMSKILPRNIKAMIAKKSARSYRNFVRYNEKLDPKLYQHPFSFFKGTLLEPLLRMHGSFGEKISENLNKADRSVYFTKFGEFCEKIFKLKIIDEKETGRIYGKGTKVLSYKFGGNYFQKLMGRSLLRMTTLSFLALGLLELPTIVKSFKNPDGNKNALVNGIAQIAKSAVYVTTMLGSIGVVGAALAPLGPAGSLVGMGLGAIVGGKSGKFINKQIDNLIA